MVKADESTSRASVGTLTQGALGDIEKLLEQHFALLRTELKEKFDRIEGAAISGGAGVGMIGLSGVLGVFALVHLVHDITRLPLWICYALVAGTAGVLGAGCLANAVEQARELSLVPKKTTEAIKEDLQAVTP
jgi:hypothetical protein